MGLVHHGSGPRHTSLLDPDWPVKLADYAASVAQRYPWVDAYTPVNEPLTTARFSALYGHWYPHARSDRAFCRALLNQLKGTMLAMQAIREVNPAAVLVQTEDLGMTHATPGLQYQARFENERRWITYDLLQGALDRCKTMVRFFWRNGVTNAAIEWFADHPCPNMIAGLNYYVLSERFLDDRKAAGRIGGNGRHRYTDCDAVRTCGLAGIGALLEQAWQRVGVDMAITEAHLAGTRDEQLRWLAYLWDGATRTAARGIPVRAVTAWSLFGAVDWDTLCTEEHDRYESGVFDVSLGEPRPTALAGAVRRMTRGRTPSHPALDQPGWWSR